MGENDCTHQVRKIGLNGGSDAGSMIETIVDLSMSDELQGARTQVVIAKLEALSKLTDKILLELDNIQILMHQQLYSIRGSGSLVRP